MDLYLVRHAESMGNATGNYSTDEADALSARGHAQAKAFAAAFTVQPLEKVVVSPLQRTLETIYPFLESNDRVGEIWPEITECCWHDEREPMASGWQSQPATLPLSIPDQGRYRFWRDQMLQPQGGETFGQGLFRVQVAKARLEELAQKGVGSILMVTHGHFLRELLNQILRIPEPTIFEHGNCGVTSLSYDGKWRVTFCNRNLIDL